MIFNNYHIKARNTSNSQTSSMGNKDVIKNYIKQHVIIGDTHGY